MLGFLLKPYLQQDEIEDSAVNITNATPALNGKADTQKTPSFTTANGAQSAEKDQPEYLQDSSTLTPGKVLPAPAIRLMQRPKEGPTEVRIPITEASKAPVRGTDPWDDEEWDSNRSAAPPNSKIWNEA
jgi:hypothetical protein